MFHMKLKDYIEAKRIKVDDAAIELGISRGYLYELIAERMTPGRKAAFEIVKWSDGMVRLDDIWDIT